MLRMRMRNPDLEGFRGGNHIYGAFAIHNVSMRSVRRSATANVAVNIMGLGGGL